MDQYVVLDDASGGRPPIRALSGGHVDAHAGFPRAGARGRADDHDGDEACMDGAAPGAETQQRSAEQRIACEETQSQASVIKALLPAEQADVQPVAQKLAQKTQQLVSAPHGLAHAARAGAAGADAAKSTAAAPYSRLVPQTKAQETQQVPAELLASPAVVQAVALAAAPEASPEAAPDAPAVPDPAAPTAPDPAVPQTDALKAPQAGMPYGPAGATAHVAKKRRITPQSTALPAPAVGVTSTHPAPTRERAIERTPEQYLQEVRRDAETIMDTMSRFQSMTATEMLYEDGVDLQSVSVLAQRVFGNMSKFQVYFRARRAGECRRGIEGT